MLHDVSIQRTISHEKQERGERAGPDTLAPVLLADPIADQARIISRPAADVARDLAIDEDRLRDDGRIAAR